MTAGRLLGAILLAFALVCAAAPSAAACSIMVDGSGSMQGFKSSPQLDHILSQLGKQCREHFVFGADLDNGPADLTAVALNKPKTELGHSLKTWLARSHERRLLILTDNVVDDGSGHADAGQLEFYQLLRSPQLDANRIAALLMRLRFSGQVYSADDHRHSAYSGPTRALMLYVIERRKEGPSEGQLDPVSFGIAQQDLTAISLKPFEAVGAKLSADVTSEERDVTFEDGAIVLARHAASQTYAFKVTARIQPSARWNFAGAPLAAQLEFPPDATFPKAAITPCAVDPKTIPPAREPFAVTITCTAPSALDQLDDAAMARQGMRRSERDGILRVALTARNQQIGLGPELQTWSFDGAGDRLADPNPAIQGSIYRLGALLVGLSPETVQPSVMTAPVVEKIYFFDPRPFVLGGLALAVVIVAAIVLLALAQPRIAEVTGGSDGVASKEIRLVGRLDVRLPDMQRATIWVLPGLTIVSALGARPPVLGAEGGAFVAGRSQTRLTLRVRSARRPQNGRSPRSRGGRNP